MQGLSLRRRGGAMASQPAHPGKERSFSVSALPGGYVSSVRGGPPSDLEAQTIMSDKDDWYYPESSTDPGSISTRQLKRTGSPMQGSSKQQEARPIIIHTDKFKVVSTPEVDEWQEVCNVLFITASNHQFCRPRESCCEWKKRMIIFELQYSCNK